MTQRAKEALDKVLYDATKDLLAAAGAAGGFCMAIHEGYACTMPKGHTGHHVAHGALGAVCDEWGANDE